jgi:succinate dehydrogenase/fumarate reductase cytochrome b subunit
LVFFLLTHITAIAQANFGITRGSMAQMFDLLRNPFWAGDSTTVAFDLIALGIVAFHGLNGIRIVLLDIGLGTRRHRLSFWVAMAIAIAASAYVITLALPMLRGG